MSFEKSATFLGYKEMVLRDGTVLYTVSFYVEDAPLEVNILASNIPVAAAVKSLSFGDSCVATFSLRKMEKLYKLSLSAIA